MTTKTERLEWDDELLAWVRSWDSEYKLAGVAETMSGLEIWFGNRKIKKIYINYPHPETLSKFLAEFSELDTHAVSSGEVRAGMLPEGWLRIVGAGVVRP